MAHPGLSAQASQGRPSVSPTADGLASALATTFTVLRDGSFFFGGSRPDPKWHRHGTTPRRLFTLAQGRLRRILIHKQRWRHKETRETRHDRPPDDVARVWSCTLVVVLLLRCWLGSRRGLHRLDPPSPLEEHVSLRTLQRWMARALPLALHTEHAIRSEWLTKCGTRPEEFTLGGGLSPPGRRWSLPGSVSTLFRALTVLFDQASSLQLSVSRLLAGARGRWTGPQMHFVV